MCGRDIKRTNICISAGEGGLNTKERTKEHVHTWKMAHGQMDLWIPERVETGR